MSLLRFAIVIAVAVACAPPAAAEPAQIVIQVYSFGFAPQPIRLEARRLIRMTFVNQSGNSHDFSAHGFFANSKILSGDAPDGEIDLPPHSSRSITLIPRAGAYHAHCSHFFHKQLGMSDLIVVE